MATKDTTTTTGGTTLPAMRKDDKNESSTGVGINTKHGVLLFILLPALVALIGGLYETTVPTPRDSVEVNDTPTNATTQVYAVATENDQDGKYPSLTDKYESALVQITTQKLLIPAPKDRACPAFETVGDITSVVDAMDMPTPQLRDEGVVFLMLNGENSGLFVKWNAADECLRELAMVAAEQLGADVDVLQNGVKLMTQMGLPITSAKQLDEEAGRIAHVLLDFQIWVWPGIKVGHVFDVDGVTVKTLSMSPRVFGVEGFFTDEEAQEIIRQGVNRLERSKVDSPEAVDGVDSDRTSFTAFLKDNRFTRDFRARTAKLTRLPSPSFVARVQLVRYEAGQFYRQHEDYFVSKVFVPVQAVAAENYRRWTEWASARLQTLHASGVEIPEEFFPGHAMHPNAEDTITFQHALLTAFLQDAEDDEFFRRNADTAWGTWIRESLAADANNIVDRLLEEKSYMLPHMIKSWEKRIGLPQLKYTIPKPPVSGVSHYFRWLRWVKERVQDLMDENPAFVPEQFRPAGANYPTYNIGFQNILMGFIVEDYSRQALTDMFNEEWADWIITYHDTKDVLLEALKVKSAIFDLALAAFTRRAGDKFAYEKPQYVQHFEPNRFVTVFLYLNDCPEGGETVFPYSKERLATDIKREGMNECSEGLAVPPTKLTAAMFYAQTPENVLDRASRHGGCPPVRGTKYGANLFAWNADADEGINAWGFSSDLKLDPRAY